MVDAGGPPAWLRDATGQSILVLGGDGFIGSYVVRAALAAGARVVAACVKAPWRLNDVAHSRDLELVAVRDDLQVAVDRHPELRGRLLANDAVALLAYEPPPPDATPTERLRHELDVNAGGTRKFAAAARAAGIPIVFASSADIYGPWRGAPISEDVEPTPATPYAVAKLEAEHVVSEVQGVSLRIATVYGPMERGPRAIPSFVRAFARQEHPIVHGDGSDIRDYVHVFDVAAAFVNAAIALSTGSRQPCVINVGSGVGRTTIEILEAVAAIMGVDPACRHVQPSRPPSRLVLDPARAGSLLGFRPRTDFTAALREEVEWLLRAEIAA